MSSSRNRKRQVFVAVVLIVALLMPAWHTGQAASGTSVPEVAGDPAGDLAGELLGASGTNADWSAALQGQIQPDRHDLIEGAGDDPWSAGGEAAGDEFGRSVATAGDVNGDGYSDVVVGAPSNSAAGSSAGKVYVYYGSASGLLLVPAWTALGEVAEDEFGSAVGAAGDLNGDGYDDLVVGAPGHEGGKVYVYYGSATGLSSAGWTASGQYAADEFGRVVGPAGDVNRDGYDDLVVGAPAYPNGSAYGKAYVYHGAAGGLGGAPTWAAGGQHAGDHFGWAAATAGDVNADGYADVVVGAPEAGSSAQGRAYVYHGGLAGLVTGAASWTDSGWVGDQFGYAVGTAGDVNGDGYSDIVVGAPAYSFGSAYGEAYVYHGAASGLATSANWNIPGDTPGNRLGASVGTASDMNGDGYADIVIGAYGSDGLAGQIQFYYGSSTGLPPKAAWTSGGENAGDRLGLAVGPAGDVNGDGYGDVIAGAPGYAVPGPNAGRAYVYQGAADAPSDVPRWSAPAQASATAGDVNGDGYSDVIVGREGQDTAWVFNGGPAGLSSTADWTTTWTDGFGRTVGTAGDVNGDGYADVVISDYRSVYVYHGSATGLTSGTPDWSAAVCNVEYEFCAAGAAGDVNGDGFGDLVVGRGGMNTAWVFYGSSTGLSSTAGWTTTGGSWFGRTVGSAGDVNGDGYADVIVAGIDAVSLYHGSAAGLTSGTPDWSATFDGSGAYPCTASMAGDVNRDGFADVVVGEPNQFSDGAVYLFLGSAMGLDAPLSHITGTHNFGSSVGTAGDVNGDGFADVIAGAPDAGAGTGEAYIFYGSSMGIDADRAWTTHGATCDEVGRTVGPAGDVDGDGFADVLVHDWYYAYLYHGNDGGGRVALPRQARGDGSLLPVQPWGQSAGDGFAVSLHVVDPLGRGRVRLQIESCPSGTAFGNAACQQYTAAGWTEVVNAAGVDLDGMAEWLEQGTLYRWRARALYATPLYPYGPWRRFLGQSQEADVRAGRPATDLRIAKTMMPVEEVVPPAHVTYTLTYVAAGGPAAHVVITDIVPAGIDNVQVITSGAPIADTGARPGYVWSVDELAMGEGGVITITGVANVPRFVNIATIRSASPDMNPQNNVAIVQTHVEGVIYVDADAWGANNGFSWYDAYTDLQDALAVAEPGDEIWVAEGVYMPTAGGDRAATFSLVGGVAIYGGFAANEAYAYERDWHAHPTVLSGDIGVPDSSADNVYHVVSAAGVGGDAVLDGFIISGGRANGEEADGLGGGIHLAGASPTLRSLALLGNVAGQGGGLYNAGSPALANVAFSGNEAASGGAIYNAGIPTLVNVTFSQNSAAEGSALYDNGTATLANCIVWDEDPGQNLIAGSGITTVSYSDVRGGYAGTGNLDADPQFTDALGADGIAGTLDDDLRLHTTFRFPSPVIDRGDNGVLPLDDDDLDGDGDTAEPLPLDLTSRARVIGFTVVTPTVDMGALEANIEDVLAEGDALLAEGKSFRLEHLQILPADTLESALQNYSNFNDGEWYYAFCADYGDIDAEGYCPEMGPEHVRNDLLDTVDVYRVAVGVWPTATWTTRTGDVIEVWQKGSQGVLGATMEIGNDHLIFGNEYLVDATDYRFSTAGIPYADQIIAQELDELGQAARQFELVMDLIFRAFGEWGVGDYCTADQFEAFGVTSSLLMSALDEMATRHYMMGDSEAARDIYLAASRNQNLHLAALAKLAQETGHAYLVNGSWEMLNNVSRMRERARQIEAGMDFFGFAPEYAPLQAYEQLLGLTEGPAGNSGLLGTAHDLEDQAREAQRTFDTSATDMATELDLWRYELDEKLFDLCGETPDEDGDGYGDYKTCEGGLMALNWAEYEAAYIRQGLAWMRAQNLARQIEIEQEQTGQTIRVILAAGREIAAAELAMGKLKATKTTQITGTSSESEFHAGGETRLEAWMEVGVKASTQVSNNEAYFAAAAKLTVAGFFGGSYAIKQSDQMQTTWDPAEAEIGAYESIKALKDAEKEAQIEGASSAATIKNLLLAQSEALEEWEVATAELNGVIVEHNNMMETWSRLVNLYAEAVPTIMGYNSHLLNPAYRLWRDSLTIQSSKAHGLAAQFAYLTARASEYELLTPYPSLGDVYKSRTANDLRIFLDELKVWHQALDLPGQLNRYPYTLSVAKDFFFLTDEQLDPNGTLSPDELAQKRYDRLQEELASRLLDGDLEIVFSTSLHQQRPGGQYVFSPNVWNNRIAGIGEPLASNVGVKMNIVTTEPLDAGMVEVVLVHDGQATYRNAAAQEVIYDPATAAPVGYLVPAELSPAYTTVVLRPDVNGAGGLPNSGLINLSVSASHWKLRIPAGTWGNLDVSQIKDIEISLDTTARALPGRKAEAEDDAERLAAGLAMAPPSEAWLHELAARQQDAPGRDLNGGPRRAQALSAPVIPGEVSGSYSGNLVVTSPITIAVQELNFDLWNVGGILTGTVGIDETAFSPEPIGLAGTATGDEFVLYSEAFTNVVNGRVVTQTFVLTGLAEEEAEVLRATYTSTIHSLLPEPIVVQGLFIASRPGAPAGSGLLVGAGAWSLPIYASTPVTVTLIDGLMQPITGTGTITFSTDLGMVTPSTVELVEGVALATFDAGGVPGEAVVFATTGKMTGTVRIQVEPNDWPIADAGADQQVDPTATVTLDGSASSDPDGDPLAYHWIQTGGGAVSFTPALSVTTFTAPASAGPLTFTLTVTDTGGLSDVDVTLITVTNLAPVADAGADQQVAPVATVTLDGSASSDPNGDALAYRWAQTGGEAVSFTPALSVTTFTAPAGAGPLTFTLTVTDTGGLADTDTTVVAVNNLAPLADAGPDQEVDPATVVTLDGSASSDPNGDALAYRWAQTGGEAVSFTAGVSVTTFTSPDGAGPLTFALTITDTGGLADTDTTVVVVNNLVPLADAGLDQVVDPAATVTLDGSASSDPNGDALVYHWTQTGGEAVSFTAGVSITTFTALLGAGLLTFALTVTDTAGLTNTDSTTVTVGNLAPLADAGPDQSVDPATVVTLDGSDSSDPNGDGLAYHWVQTGGEVVSFSPALSVTTFTAPAGAGLLTFALTVTDTAGLTNTDSTTVTVGNLAPLADAGPDLQVGPGAVVILDGSGSSDPNGDALAYHWTQAGGIAVGFSPAVSVTTFIAPGTGLLTFTLIVTDTAGASATDEMVITVTKTRLYLPLVLKGSSVVEPAPDLVVKSVAASSDSVQVVIENQGDAPVGADTPFWVDLYVAPDPAPTAVNQPWNELCEYGLVWGIPAGALPLDAGEGVTLTYSTEPGAPNLYYWAELSNFGGSLAEGTPVYVQVDAWNDGTAYGAVLEGHERLGGAYNNIAGPVYSTAGIMSQGQGAGVPPDGGSLPTSDGLPPRP